MRATLVWICGSLFLTASSLLACGGSGDSPAATNPGDVDAAQVAPHPDAAPPRHDAGIDASLPSQDDAGADVVTDAAADPSEAGGAPTFPQLVNRGGPVLTSPKLVPIFFPGYDFTTQVTDFVSKVGATDYWKANTAEYGAGMATGGTPAMMNEAAPAMITDQGIQTWLIKQASMGTLGTLDTQAIYTVYYPSTTVVSMGGGTSCVDFGGYHSNFDYFTTNYAYAVIPECTNFKTLKGIDMVTGASSHEFVEAATDPFPNSTPAFAGEDLQHVAWEFFSVGGENGDMCAQNATAFYKPAGFAYTVQRAWSNAAAALGHDPCVPAIPSLPYFNSVPRLPDMVSLHAMLPEPVPGILMGQGASRTIELDLFSEAPTSGPWTITGQDENTRAKGTQLLEFTFDKPSGVNGDKIMLTIKVLELGASGTEAFLLTSQLGDQRAFWAGIVSTN